MPDSAIKQPFVTPAERHTAQASCFAAYLSAYENLTPQSLMDELAPLFSETVEFKDPFNHVFNKSAAVSVFEHMFSTTVNPKFTVKQRFIEQTDQTSEHFCGMAFWQFEFQTTENSNVNCIQGSSLIEIDGKGKVCKHIDFWDPAENIYEGVPLLGSIMRFIKKKLRAQ